MMIVPEAANMPANRGLGIGDLSGGRCIGVEQQLAAGGTKSRSPRP
jgi:hypothetical protein